MKTTIGKIVRTTLIFALLSPMPVSAEKCPSCQEKMFTADIGACKDCGGDTASGAFKLCPACSKKTGQCEACQAKLPATKPVPANPKQEKPAAGLTLENLLAAPKEIVVGDKHLELETSLWRNMMPGTDPDRGLMASIKLKTSGPGELPAGITVTKVWIVNGKDLWSPEAIEVRDRAKDSPFMEVVVRKGPDWKSDSKLTVIVQVKDANDKSSLLKIADQGIEEAH